MSVLIFFGVWAAIFLGWIMNAVTAVKALIALPHLADISGLLIAQLAGIPLAPIGAVLGWVIW